MIDYNNFEQRETDYSDLENIFIIEVASKHKQEELNNERKIKAD